MAAKFTDLRKFIHHLEILGQLKRITALVDPDQEITVIQDRILGQGGPALLFENVKGSAHPIVSNLFGTRERVNMVMGGDPAALGERILRISEKIMPPSLKGLISIGKDIFALAPARMKRVSKGPILESVSEPPDILRLPVLTCWPEDGGPFITLPLVHTQDPVTGRGNLGMYRLQRFDATTTGMHWQIERGGGFHYHRACKLGRPLKVSVTLGGPPALIIAAITPLPEGLDERLLAAYMMGAPLAVIRRKGSGHLVPAEAEFVLEGEVAPNEMRREGPFGDHFGHYSQAADYPVFRVRRILARRDAIYPATVVGKPLQEDYFIGEALQDLGLPLLKMIRPAVTDLWAYAETGFHPLAVMATKERYPKEALKHTLGMLGEGQISMTKVMITVAEEVPVRDFLAVSRALWRHLDPAEGIHLFAPTAQDTLDFTGPAMNVGSRLILLALPKEGPPLRDVPPPQSMGGDNLHARIRAMQSLGPAFLLVQVESGTTTREVEAIRQALQADPVAGEYLFQVLLSEDVPLTDRVMVLWGWFTRFDPLADLYPAKRKIVGNRLVFDFPILIDARWKKGYPRPVEFDPEIVRRVADRWKEYGL
jgi:UbiD family decarboxylase